MEELGNDGLKGCLLDRNGLALYIPLCTWLPI